MEDNIFKISPGFLLRTVSIIEDENHKKRYLREVLDTMKENRYDIRQFNFAQISTFIDLVGTYQ